MVERKSKITNFVDNLYLLIKVSLMYWGYLFRYLIIYGQVKAFNKGLVYLGKLKVTSHNKKKEKSSLLNLESGLSCLLSLSLILIFVALNLSSEISLLLLIMGLTLLVFFLPLSVFYVYEKNTFQDKEALEILYLAFKDLYQRFPLTLYVLSLFLVGYFIFLLNKILFLFFFPGLALELLGRVFNKSFQNV